jgi:nucleotide-binding universal stress UspA family protein
MFQPRLILHPTDFSDCSNHAFQAALDLARQYGATVLVLHVVETLGPENVTYGEATSQLQPESYRVRLAADLKRLTSPPDSGVTVRHLLAEGDAAEQIDQAAQDHHSDLIVMGTHGRTRLERFLMGSIAEKTIRLASCPVLVMKLPTKQEG